MSPKPPGSRVTAGPRRLVTLAEAAVYLGITPRSVRRYIAGGQLTGYRIGPKLIKVDLNEIDHHLSRPIPSATA